jgi:hypothetical protein
LRARAAPADGFEPTTIYCHHRLDALQGHPQQRVAQIDINPEIMVVARAYEELDQRIVHIPLKTNDIALGG